MVQKIACAPCVGPGAIHARQVAQFHQRCQGDSGGSSTLARASLRAPGRKLVSEIKWQFIIYLYLFSYLKLHLSVKQVVKQLNNYI